MATQKININPEKVKKLIKDLTKDSNIIMDPHGRQRAYGSKSQYQHEGIRESIPVGSGPISSQTINHCQLGGAGGMAGCYACHYDDTKSKVQCQRACHFFEKSRFHERCMWETYEEYCWSTKAQDAKKAKGF
jgi:hypothetical protein